MAVNINWPLMVTQVAFNSGFATTTLPSWTDLTPRMWSFGCQYGRQYELDQNQTGTGSLVLGDPDEVLNPAHPNPGYPYAGNILPYRPAMVQAQWPPAPVGGAVNLLNSGTQSQPYDPSFESYTAAATVPWISAVGGTSPVVGTATPRAGAKDLTWTVAGTTAVQGVSWPVPCIPGQQYTSSTYVRQSSASTQAIRVTDQNLVVDAFNRTSVNGWGTADLGGAWTTSGGAAADYSTTAKVASHSHSSVSVSRRTVAGSGIVDSDQRVTITVPVVAAGAEIDAGLISRWTASTDYYFAEARFNPDGTVGLRIQKFVASALTSIGTATLAFSYVAGSVLYLRFQTVGPTVRVKAWPFGTAEPAAWSLTVTDTSLTAAGQVGCRSVLSAGNTNALPVAVAFMDYSVSGSVAGSSTTTTGAYVRLTVTWTATQPMHTIQIATTGTAVAGTVLADDVQHEPGAAATTATTSGPVIYGVHRGYVERWPSNWSHQGMYGYCQVTTVDAFAALAARKMRTAYPAAVLAKAPTYYWRLAEQAGAVTFADGSGNSGPSLTRYNASGTGPTFAAGTATNIPGDPAGTGLAADTGAVSVNVPSSVAQTGLAGTPALAVPVGGSGWTIAFWLSHTTETVSGAAQYALAISSTGNVTEVAAQVYFLDTPNRLVLFSRTGVPSCTIQITDSWADGKPHLYLARGGLIGGANTDLWVDGVQVGGAANGASTLTASNSIQVGGYINPAGVSNPAIPGGIYSGVALWNRQLTSAEIADLWSAGQGYPGETSGQRIARYLAGNYSGPTAIDTGLSTMGVDVLADKAVLLAASQAVTTSENGNLWVDGPGTLTFYSRSRRYTTTTAKYTFGENELPYQGDIAFDYDIQLVYNDVSVTNAGGAKPNPIDLVSRDQYGPKSYSRDLNVLSDNEATDAATWILATHKDPYQRIARLTLEPSSNPALWPVALGIRIGDRVTAKRRTSAFTMSGDYYVEKISHGQAPSRWIVALELSPAALWPTPWILDDPTYSILGQTTTLGY